VARLEELALLRTEVRGDGLAHLHRLSLGWRLLADLSFSDLLLLVPVAGDDGHRFVVVDQVRPTTGQTVYPRDLVGSVVSEVERPLVSRAWTTGEICAGETTVLGGRERVRLQCIPVRHRGRVLAVLVRESPVASFRRPGELERYYLEAFDHLARMVADGTFPFAREEVELEGAPRVGDGVILLDEQARIRYASPNAVSSLHRMGIHAYTTGVRPADLGFAPEAVDSALRGRIPVIEEIERDDASILVRVVPLLEDRRPIGALVLLRDVTELRRRDRMLMSKDATIREIHHRVKNNLQTIAALLRLQARRVASEEARKAIAESERRIRSIAVVHETLSRESAELVPFNEILGPLVRAAEEAVPDEGAKVDFVVTGDAGQLPGEIATPLAVVVNELLQNAAEHAFPPRTDGEPSRGTVEVHLQRTDGELCVEVADDGIGLPDDLAEAARAGLGLSIVQALVTGELGGRIDASRNGGTRIRVRVPLRWAGRAEVEPPG
jgi:two-component sensor histidine kinase